MKASNGHDIIVIGASAGGLDALRTLIGGFPPALPASVFIVQHIGATSHLADILDNRSPLPASEAKNGEPIERGRIYVAGPGKHLMVHEQHVMLRRGPRENMSRPAIDPLFRSAALTFGARVIGIVLSGALSDGTAGLKAIKRCGGIAVVQDPADAAVSEMPASAIRHVAVDHVVPIVSMGPLVARLVDEPAGETPEPPAELRLETAISAREVTGMAAEDKLGAPSSFSCPECGGVLWEIGEGGLLRFRCNVGHAFTADAAFAAQADKIEDTLGTLMRAHQEHGALARRMAAQARSQGIHRLAEELDARAKEYEDGAQLVRTLFVDTANAAGVTEIVRQGPAP